MLALGLALAAACDRAERALDDMEDFYSRMCACKDRACVEAVQRDFREWRKHEPVKKDDLSGKQRARMGKIADGMDDCRDRMLNAVP
jgi:hypothetical protein